jgi:hypothetical protein
MPDDRGFYSVLPPIPTQGTLQAQVHLSTPCHYTTNGALCELQIQISYHTGVNDGQ